MTDADSFADAPQSIGELRTEKSQSPTDWSARDALVRLLRGIDSGEIKADLMFVAWGERRDKSAVLAHYCVAGSANQFETTGMIKIASDQMHRDAYE